MDQARAPSLCIYDTWQAPDTRGLFACQKRKLGLRKRKRKRKLFWDCAWPTRRISNSTSRLFLLSSNSSPRFCFSVSHLFVYISRTLRFQHLLILFSKLRNYWRKKKKNFVRIWCHFPTWMQLISVVVLLIISIFVWVFSF